MLEASRVFRSRQISNQTFIYEKNHSNSAAPDLSVPVKTLRSTSKNEREHNCCGLGLEFRHSGNGCKTAFFVSSQILSPPLVSGHIQATLVDSLSHFFKFHASLNQYWSFACISFLYVFFAHVPDYESWVSTCMLAMSPNESETSPLLQLRKRHPCFNRP